MDLVKLALAAEQLAQNRPPITLDPMRCLWARDKSADCDLCARVCPVGAIQIHNGPQVDAETCARCGLCLHRCPTGALDGRDETHRLLYCVSQLVDRESVEIACAFHPDPTPGDPNVEAVIRTSGCLAAFGPSVYISLAALDVHHVYLRLDACAQCPLSALKPELELAVQRASSLLTALDRSDTVTVAASPDHPKQRPLYSVKNPPVSRRGLFQALTGRAVGRAGDMIPPHMPQIEGEKSSPRERRRYLNAIRYLTRDGGDHIVPGDSFTRLMVSDTCTACEVCTRICPTGALDIQKAEGRFQLTFLPADCTNCGLCLKFCDTGALQRDGAPTIAELLTSEKVVLRSGSLHRCRKCGAQFAGQSTGGLCPVCAFRKNNPFGARLPNRRIQKHVSEGHLPPSTTL